MKRLAIFLILVCAAGCVSAKEYHPRPDSIWPIVAQSHIIATGTLTVPVDHIRSCQASNQHDYTEISVTVDQMLKGNPPKTFVVRWYTKPLAYAPEPERLIAFNGKRALLFLVDVEDAPVRGYYFAGYTPMALSDSGDAQIKEVKREIAAQKQLLVGFDKAFTSSEDPLRKKVKDLIDDTTRKDSQMAAFRELEELGPKAVPAIIMLMDDRRDLAIPSISLRNKSPDAFEGIRHYGPKKVVDAMDAILNQITVEAFGAICNGGTDRERQETVNGWRIYLHYLNKESHNQMPVDTTRTLADPQH